MRNNILGIFLTRFKKNKPCLDFHGVCKIFGIFVDLIQKALSKTKKNQKAIFKKSTYKSIPRTITRVYQEQVSAHLPCSELTRVQKTVF